MAAQAGFYDDGSGTRRWWDGANWTDRVEQPQPGPGGIGGFVSRIEADTDMTVKTFPSGQRDNAVTWINA